MILCSCVHSLGSQMQRTRSTLHLRDGRLSRVASGGGRVLLQLGWAGLVGRAVRGSGFLGLLPRQITPKVRLAALAESCHLAAGIGILSGRGLCGELALIGLPSASGICLSGLLGRANCHQAAPSTRASWLTAGAGSLRGGGRLEQRAEVRGLRLTHTSGDVPQDWRKETGSGRAQSACSLSFDSTMSTVSPSIHV